MVDLPAASDIDIDRALAVAREAVAAAAAAALPHFRPEGIDARRKADRSPVTAADLAAEAAILAVLRRAFPDHAILAEESGAHAGAAETRWIVDPLDGTRGFSRGGAFWGPLLALQHRGQILVGVMALPARGETYYAARGRGAFCDGQRLQVSRGADWSDATLSVGGAALPAVPAAR